MNQKKRFKKEKEFINRFRSNIKKAAMVQSRIKALEKMEIIKPEAEEKKFTFDFLPLPQQVREWWSWRECPRHMVIFKFLKDWICG